jgi:hypothetical protein
VAQYFNSINKDFNKYNIGGVRIISVFECKVQGCCNLDHHKDTLIFSKIINTNILEAKKY